MTSYKTYNEIAEQLGVSIDTIRRNVKSEKVKLGLDPKKLKTPTSKGALVSCLSLDDSDKLIRSYNNKGKSDINTSSNRNYGYFYLIQLIPRANAHFFVDKLSAISLSFNSLSAYYCVYLAVNQLVI